MEAHRHNALMDRFASCWLWMRRKIYKRPLAVIGALLGATIWLALMVWLFVQTENTQDEIKNVAAALCGGMPNHTNPRDLPPKVQKNCQLLFDRIFENATPQQIERANEIMRNGHP